DAARLVRDLYKDDPPALKQHLGDLRNEAIACLALTDMKVARRWPGNPEGTTAVALEPSFRRYARADGQGHVSLRTVPSSAALSQVPPRDEDAPAAKDGDHDDRELQQFSCFDGPVAELLFSPDSRYLAARARENFWIWDVKSAAPVVKAT